MRSSSPVVLALLLISTVSCGRPTTPTEDRIRQELVGTWMSETNEEGVRIRVVVNVIGGGGFREVESSVDPDGTSKQNSYAGEWSFDGTNFKRRYTSKDDQPLPNSQVGYTTYAVSMFRADEFLGVDHGHRRTVKFSRMNASTKP
jgi:hypothetical protein